MYSKIKTPFDNQLFRDYPDMLTVTDATKALGIGRNATYRLIRSGTLRSLRIGRSIRIAKSWLIDYVTQNSAGNGISDTDSHERRTSR